MVAANVFAPTGLVWSRNIFGAAPTAQANAYFIRKGAANAIGIGDLVKTGSGADLGYVIPSVFGDTSGLGVFAGCLPYFDTVLQATSHGGPMGSYNPNASPSADIPCLVISGVSDAFRAQVSNPSANSSWSTASRGQNCTFVNGTNGVPNAAGISTLAIFATFGTSSTLPFRILGPTGVVGGPQDPNNANYWIEVSFNPGWLESMQAAGV